mgnify:CR=1 FL=1
MIFNIKFLCYFVIFISIPLSNNLKTKPILFYYNSSKGSDWIYKNNPLTIFGAGLEINYSNPKWDINATYIQFGFLGEIGNGLHNFSPTQSFPYIDDSKDADGHWSEYIDTRITYNNQSLSLEFGKFDRHWGHGKRALHISNKTPSYPQFGMNWEINNKLKIIYFHGFLKSGIIDSSRLDFYHNSFSKRSINIPRNIASHRIEWSVNNKLKISGNETVIYALRDLDIHYMIPIAPFYPIENYLGDTDNLQMGFDAIYLLENDKKIYFAFFMDELTPEWIFKKKNHNWFAWQFGYEKMNFIIKNSYLLLEYNWTDQRIYKHKYNINDYYSHGLPLGFWAGPHSEEVFTHYSFSIRKNIIELESSFVKRGNSDNEFVQKNYNDTYNSRYSDGAEKKQMITIRIKRLSNIKGLDYILGINQTKFSNLELDNINIKKTSIEIGLNYNFSTDRMHD